MLWHNNNIISLQRNYRHKTKPINVSMWGGDTRSISAAKHSSDVCSEFARYPPPPLPLFSSVRRRLFDFGKTKRATLPFDIVFAVLCFCFYPRPPHHDANNFRYRIGRRHALRIPIISIFIREFVRIRKLPFYGSLAKWSSNVAANEVMVIL